LSGMPPVVVEIVDIDPVAAVSRAVERVARHIRDSANRRRDRQRRPGPGMPLGRALSPSERTKEV
jgi:hypothetical protein